MAAGDIFGFMLRDKRLVSVLREICSRHSLSHRVFGEAIAREIIDRPIVLEAAIARAHQLMHTSIGEISRLHAENLALRQRIAELEKLHPDSIQISPSGKYPEVQWKH